MFCSRYIWASPNRCRVGQPGVWDWLLRPHWATLLTARLPKNTSFPVLVPTQGTDRNNSCDWVLGCCRELARGPQTDDQDKGWVLAGPLFLLSHRQAVPSLLRPDTLGHSGVPGSAVQTSTEIPIARLTHKECHSTGHYPLGALEMPLASGWPRSGAPNVCPCLQELLEEMGRKQMKVYTKMSTLRDRITNSSECLFLVSKVKQ